MIGTVLAEEISVEVQTPNDTDLTISGIWENPIAQDPIVTIIIEDQDRYPILLAPVSPDETGYFSLDVKRQGPLWDDVTEFFVKAEVPDTDVAGKTTVTEYGNQNLGKISWGQASYSGFENSIGTIQVIDPDVNLYPNAIDFLRVNVWSDSSPSKTLLTLTETGMDTGVFEGEIIFSNKYYSSRGVVFVSVGDTVTASYEDKTVPRDLDSDTYEVKETSIIAGKRGPPLERAPASNLKILNINNEPVANNAIAVDQQIRLILDLENQQDREQPFAFLVQIQNSKNQVESLSWITGNLTASQKLQPSVAWIPFERDMYTATVFVWESVNNPTALSPPVSIEFSVK